MRYLLTRIGGAVIVLFVVSLFIFVLIRLLPGSPAMALYGEQWQKMSAMDQWRIEENLGLHEALPIQYGKWLAGLGRGEWGKSYLSGADVSEMIGAAAGPTALLAVTAAVWALLLSLVLGLYSGLTRHSWQDYLITVMSMLLLSLPVFWLALLVLLLFSVKWGWFPSGGMGDGGFADLLHHLVLPALVLAVSHIGYSIRLLRGQVIAVSEKPFIHGLRSRGISDFRIIWRHLLRNAALPFLSYTGVSLSVTLAGSAVIETLFSWPGLGQMAMKAALARDYPVVLAATMVSSAFVVLGSLAADIAAAWLDPRLRAPLLARKGEQ